MSDEEVPLSDLPSGSEVPPEDLPSEDTATAKSGQEVPPEDLPEQDLQQQYSTPGQKLLTGIEGVARGATAGLSDALAVGMRKGASALGVPDEDLNYIAPAPESLSARKEANPIEAGATELAGNIGLMNRLPQIGSKAVNSMLQMGLISGGDELSKALMGQGDPLTAVASHIAQSGALGLVTGGLFGKLEQPALKAIENSKLGMKMTGFLSGLAHAANFPSDAAVELENSAFLPEQIKNMDKTAFKAGQELFHNIGPLSAAGTAIGMTKSLSSGFGAFWLEKQLAKTFAPQLSAISQKYVGPALLKAAASGSVENLSMIMDHATACGKGFSKISNAVESLFKGTGNKAIDLETSDKDREKLDKYLQYGGAEQEVRDEAQQQGIPQGFADGGVVPESGNPVARVFPEQNTLLSATQGRISNYLNSLRPIQNQTKLPYDSDRQDPTKVREYHKALDMANQPLSVLNHIKSGTLLPKHMVALNSMYPELKEHLSKKITERMAKGQLSGEAKPNYQMRQALSLFLGSNLESTLTPQNMMAAQSVFAQQAQQKSMASAKASGLMKSIKNSQTAQQGAEARLNKS